MNIDRSFLKARVAAIVREKLTEEQRAYLDRELRAIAASYNVPLETLYQLDFSKMIKRDDSALRTYLNSRNTLNNAYDMQQAQSLKDGLEVGSSAYGAGKLLQGAKAIEGIMSNSTKFTLGVAGAGSVGGQLMSDGTVDPRSLAIDLATAYALKGKGFGLTVGGNATSGALNNYVTDKSISQGAISSGIGSAIGYGLGKAVEIPLDKKINPDLTWSKYNPLPLNDKVPYVDVYRRNIVPSISGSTMSEIGNRVFQNYYTKPNEEK